VATDHAPHTLEEKKNNYMKAPSGGPLVQHALTAMLEKSLEGKITIEKVVEKMCHNPAKLFQIKKRGYIKEGYYADLAIVDMNSPWTVDKNNIIYKCAWSPFEGNRFRTKVTHTFVNGHLAYNQGQFSSLRNAKRLTFDR
jgi:dihydroorotase